MLEHFNPELKRVLSQPPTRFKRPASATFTKKNGQSSQKIFKAAKKDVKHNALFYKKQAEFQTLIKKREQVLKAAEKALKVKKRKKMEVYKVNKRYAFTWVINIGNDFMR